MKKDLKQLLDYLSEHIDPVREKKKEELFKKSLRYTPVKRLPLLCSYPLTTEQPFQPYPHGEIFSDPEIMLFNELVYASQTCIAYNHTIQDDLPLTIRANFGIIIVASILGGYYEYHGDNPPWVKPFEDRKSFFSIFSVDPKRWTESGIMPQVIERYYYYREVLANYPKLQDTISVVLPDTQGPLDTIDLLRGSEMHLDFYQEPELIHDALALAAEVQITVLKRLLPLSDDEIKGRVLVKNDSSIMISPELYREKVAPHDEFVLKMMGGGGIHSCGKMDQLTDAYLELPSLSCIDLGQSWLNNVDAMYAKASRKKVPLIRVAATKEELITGTIMDRFPTGVVLTYEAESPNEAAETTRRYKEATERRAE